MSIQRSTEKQPPSVYTVMLVLSMIFLLIAVIAMWMELNRWQPELWNTQEAKPANAMVVPASEFKLV